MLIPVIMAGGTGTRLWPLSRGNLPKQFLTIFDGLTMLQATLTRLQGLDIESPIIICNEEQRFIVAEQARQVGVSAKIVLEPVGRDTAPAVALAALLSGSDPKAILLLLAADHIIEDVVGFQDCVKNGLKQVARGENIVTFGVSPTRAETGYGYIKASEKGVLARVEAFVEKPHQSDAEEFVKSGCHYWNSGMFMTSASHYLAELNKYQPDVVEHCTRAFDAAKSDLNFLRIDKDIFANCPSISIDYAVMEKAKDVYVVPMNVGWSDIGSWRSIWEIEEKDKFGNVCKGDIEPFDTTNSYIRTDDRLITTLGLDNIAIIDTKDALLVADLTRVQDIKKIVNLLKSKERTEHEFHREVYRPWGKYDSVDSGPRYQVKRITVKPGERLSVQMHYHRAEHWIVVSGSAIVERGQEKITVTENESIYIPVGTVHSLENPGKIPLELIEVQSGSYLGEDDIVRFDDRYGRA